MDVETVRYVEGEMYLKQLFTTLAAALDTFSPDLVIWVAGASLMCPTEGGKGPAGDGVAEWVGGRGAWGDSRRQGFYHSELSNQN